MSPYHDEICSLLDEVRRLELALSASKAREEAQKLRLEAQALREAELVKALKEAGEEIAAWRGECDKDRSRHGVDPAYTNNYFPDYIITALNAAPTSSKEMKK